MALVVDVCVCVIGLEGGVIQKKKVAFKDSVRCVPCSNQEKYEDRSATEKMVALGKLGVDSIPSATRMNPRSLHEILNLPTSSRALPPKLNLLRAARLSWGSSLSLPPPTSLANSEECVCVIVHSLLSLHARPTGADPLPPGWRH